MKVRLFAVLLAVFSLAVFSSIAQENIPAHRAFELRLAPGLHARDAALSFAANGTTGLPGLDALMTVHALESVRPVFGRSDRSIRFPGLFHELGMDRYLTVGWAESSGQKPAFVVQGVLDQLQNLPEVEYAAVNVPPKSFGATPDDPDLTNQYHHVNINSTQAWAYTHGDTNVLVAVIDWGLNTNNADFDLTLLTNGYDYVDGDNTPEDPSGYHGTAIQGVISAIGSNTTLGAGLAWGCRYMPIRVYNTSGVAYPDDCADAIRDAADAGAGVINCSWGGPYEYASISAACAYADTGANAVIAAAMGNNAALVTNNPAGFPETLAVGGTFCYPPTSSMYAYDNWRYDLTMYGMDGSTWGNHIDVVAPAAPVYTTYYTTMNWLSGTSYATPIVASFAALLKTLRPDWLNGYVDMWIRWSTQDQVGDPTEDTAGWDMYMGSGLIDLGWGIEQAVMETNCPYTAIIPYDQLLEIADDYGIPTPSPIMAPCSMPLLKPFYWLRDHKFKQSVPGRKLIRDYYRTAPAVAGVVQDDFELIFDFLAHARKSIPVIAQIMENPQGTITIPVPLWQDSCAMADRIMPQLHPEVRAVLAPWVQQGKTEPLLLLQDLGINAQWAQP